MFLFTHFELLYPHHRHVRWPPS